MLSKEVRWLLKEVRPFLGLHISCLFCYFLTTFITLLSPLIVKWIIDDIIPERDLLMLLMASAAFFLPTFSA